MGSPFLVGQTVILRPLERDDLDGPYPVWLNDQDGDAFTEHAIFPHNRSDIEEFHRGLQGARDRLVLALERIDTREHVGNIALQNINWISRRAEFAILVGAPDARGRGLGTEATGLLLRHGFNRLNLHRIELGVREDNAAALKLYRRLGFREEGHRRDAILSNQRYFDVVVMSLLSTDAAARELGVGESQA